MNLNVLYSNVAEKDFILKVLDRNEEVFDYFFMNDENSKKIESIKLDDNDFLLSKKIDPNIFFEKYDFFENSIGIPIFSEKAYKIINEETENEAIFIKCYIVNYNKTLYALYPIKKGEIITQRKGMNFIIDESKIDFKFCFHDLEYTTFLYTDLFLDIIKNNNLNINFRSIS
ncbi:hypothetical protein G9F32_16515 [Acinetobacter sp. 194]|uniref:hypothetical protein n=1 Tax=Acinetobacter shaoyimingii TaxID=2715164 RepID=UPI00140D0544|nr:hypothetical protein [Acinetobacter shaoyimingii]NHB59596.1 hypothetical protein [Acinetobacter shaoyimingii]